MENIEECTKNKNVINIIGPVANQIVSLKSKFGTICNSSTVLQLIKQCEQLQESSLVFMSSISSKASSECDQELVADIRPLSQRLNKVTKDITDSTRDLDRDDDINVKDNEDVWHNLCELAEQLLTIIVDALLLYDRSQLRKVEKSIGRFKDAINNVLEIHVLEHLNKGMSDLVMMGSELYELILERCQNLHHRAQSDTVELILYQIHQMLPVLAASSAVFVYYADKDLKLTQELYAERLFTLLRDLEKHVGLGTAEYEMDEATYFLHSVDKALSILINDDGSNKEDKVIVINLKACESLKPIIESILQHSIAVSQCCDVQESKNIIISSENVLKQLKLLMNHLRNPYTDSIDINIARDNLIDYIEVLEQKTNTALIRLIVQVFHDPLDPLVSLLKILYLDDTKKEEIDVDKLIAKFDLHMDNLFQIGRFTIACTTALEKVQTIRNNLMTLEWLESSLVAAIQSAYSERNEHSIIHAHLLADHWQKTVLLLRDALDEILDSASVCLVTKQEIHKHWAQVKKGLFKMSVTSLDNHCNTIKKLSLRILQLDESLKFLTDAQNLDIKSSLCEMNTVRKSIKNSPDDSTLRTRLLKRMQLVLTIFARISSFLNEEDASLVETCDEKVLPLDEPSSQMKPIDPELAKVLLTSQIENIPVDGDTPIPKLISDKHKRKLSAEELNSFDRFVLPSRKSLKRSVGSLSKLGETRCKSLAINASLAGSSKGETMFSEQTSIDITKFLNSRSSNRSSIRNYSLKVKEINLDIHEILEPDNSEIGKENISNLNEKHQKSKMDVNKSNISEESSLKSFQENFPHSNSLKDVSDLIKQHQTMPLGGTSSLAEELTDILENLTSLTNSLSMSVRKENVISPANSVEVCQVSCNDSINKSSISESRYPEIRIDLGEEFQEKSSNQFIDGEKVASLNETIGKVFEKSVWERFTDLFKTKTAQVKQSLDFFDTKSGESPCQDDQFLSRILAKPNMYSSQENWETNFNNRTPQLSDSPFLSPSHDCSFGCKAAFCSTTPPLSNSDRTLGCKTTFSSTVPSTTSLESISAASMEFSTPQRLYDLCIVKNRLASLKALART